MIKRTLWMRVGARVLANGRPGEITAIFSHTDKGGNYVDYVTVRLEGHTTPGPYRPIEIQLDRREVSHG